MAKLELITTAKTYELNIHRDETLLECFRRNNIPVQCCIVVDAERKFVSLSHAPSEEEELRAYSLRNHDFECLLPEYVVARTGDPVIELIRPLHNPKTLGLVQYSRSEALEFVYASVKSILDQYKSGNPKQTIFQVALSPGGDGRILAECLARYRAENPSDEFHCVIVAVGFEDEAEHIENAEALAKRFDFSYSSFGVRAAADLLGYAIDLKTLSDRFRQSHPFDEAEVMLTYWVQETNRIQAELNGRRGIIFGFNQEDVIAEKIYQAMSGQSLPSLPIREGGSFDVIAPLAYVPKKMLDSLDLTNSLRNYRMRTPSISYLRSSLYFLSYMIVEQFPSIGDVLVDSSLAARDPDHILQWLAQYQVGK